MLFKRFQVEMKTVVDYRPSVLCPEELVCAHVSHVQVCGRWSKVVVAEGSCLDLATHSPSSSGEIFGAKHVDVLNKCTSHTFPDNHKGIHNSFVLI